MTAIADATTVIETLIGRTLTAQQLSNIGNRFRQADPYSLAAPDDNGVSAYFADPENPTNEEMAQLLLDTFKTYAKDVVRKMAETEQVTSNEGSVEAAGNTAVADLE